MRKPDSVCAKTDADQLCSKNISQSTCAYGTTNFQNLSLVRTIKFTSDVTNMYTSDIFTHSLFPDSVNMIEYHFVSFYHITAHL